MKKIVSAALVCVLLVGCVLALASCAPNSDPFKAKAALEAEGYGVVLNTTIVTEDVTAILTATKEGRIVLTVTYFKDADEAKDAWEEVSKADRDEYLEANEDCVWARSGKMIYKGSKEAANAAR